MKIDKSKVWIGSPEEAEDALREHYRNMTPQQRLDEMAALLDRWGGWSERRLERVAQFFTIPKR
jgi:hypothetical protein